MTEHLVTDCILNTTLRASFKARLEQTTAVTNVQNVHSHISLKETSIEELTDMKHTAHLAAGCVTSPHLI